MTRSDTIYRKLLHFTEVGKAYTLAENDLLAVLERLRRRRRDGKQFKYKQVNNGEYLIWRTK